MDDLNIIYKGIGSCDATPAGNAVYNVVLPELTNTSHAYRLDEVYDFTGSWSDMNTLVLMMTVDGMSPDVDLSDFAMNGYNPQNVILKKFTFTINKNDIKVIPANLIPDGATYDRYDDNSDDFMVIVYHDDDSEEERIEDAVKDIISVKSNKSSNKGITRKDIPKTMGLGTLKRIRP